MSYYSFEYSSIRKEASHFLIMNLVCDFKFYMFGWKDSVKFIFELFNRGKTFQVCFDEFYWLLIQIHFIKLFRKSQPVYKEYVDREYRRILFDFIWLFRNKPKHTMSSVFQITDKVFWAIL